MRSLPALLVITVLFSTTQYLDPLRQLSIRRRHGEAQSVELSLSLAVELSPAPLMWKTLNPEVQLYVLGSAHVSVDHAQYQDEAPLRPEFLDPVYLASKLLCGALIHDFLNGSGCCFVAHDGILCLFLHCEQLQPAVYIV